MKKYTRIVMLNREQRTYEATYFGGGKWYNRSVYLL